MTEQMTRLQAALKTARPAPDPGRREGHIGAAMAAFDEGQGQATQGPPVAMRLTFIRAISGRVSEGASRMIDRMRTRAGLAMTTGLVTAGVALLLVLPQIERFSPAPPLLRERTEADKSAAPQTVHVAEPAPHAPENRAEATDAARTHLPAASGLTADAVERLAVAPAPLTLGNDMATSVPESVDAERYARVSDNPVVRVADEPVSTFSVDVDTASYGIVRSSLTSGQLPPRDAVRVEEMINYFPYAYAAPEPGGAPFRADVSVMPTPWNEATRLVRIGLQGALPTLEARPPLNLVFLIDTSGSMQDASKLPLLKQSLRLMIGQLRPDDQVAIVTYAGSSGLVLKPTPGGERSAILTALDRLEAGGGTAGQAGLTQAYAVAAQMAEDGEVTRLLLATDGDFNIGPSDPEALKQFVERERERGAYLSVLGFGRGNLNDEMMQTLAQNGNGQAAYIDTLAEAQKVLVDQLTGALFPIAQDVKVQVEFNPAEVAEYRLIGYETRALAREDFNDDGVDAGEVGAGHQVTALYEVTAPDSPALLTEPLRYQPSEETKPGVDGELGYLRLRWKAPGAAESQLIDQPIPAGETTVDPESGFAAAIAGFGQLLRGSHRLGDWNYGDAIELANASRGPDAFGYRAEAMQLMRLAESLSKSAQ
jgi:Ca-activated chloride channel family protein